MPSPRFSIITPTWNRAHLLNDVYLSLVNQSYKDFEWIIADDGSTDDTREIVASFIDASVVSIVYLRATAHVGKPRIDNAALECVSGSLVLWCDSDDTLASDCLLTLEAHSEIFLSSGSYQYAFLTALSTSSMHPQSTLNLSTSADSPQTWNKFVTKNSLNTDLLICFNSAILCQYRFPEVDLYVPVSALWNQLGDKYYVRHLPMPLLLKNYNSSHAVSFTSKIKYNRGYAAALCTFLNSSCSSSLSFRQLLFKLVNYIRFSFHGQISVSCTISQLSSIKLNYLFV